MNKRTYFIHGIEKTAEVDDWNDGCLPETFTCFDIAQSFTASSMPELIADVARFVGAYNQAQIETHIDDSGQLELYVIENADGWPATDEDRALWKLGKKTLYACTYTARLRELTDAGASDQDITDAIKIIRG